MPIKKLGYHLFLLVSLAGILLVYWIGYGKPMLGIDDANIYFVYMKNFAQGHGFVWNVGGEKVEGFTSLIWTLIGSLFYKITPGAFNWLLMGVNFIFTYLTISSLLSFLKRLNNEPEGKIGATDIIVLSVLYFPLGFIEWSLLSLMETGLWILLITTLTIDLCRYYLNGKLINPYRFGFLLSILVLTRPESLFFGIIFIGVFMVQLRSLRQKLTTLIIPIASFVGTFIAVTAWRMYYFKYPLPNTYYAKVSGNMVSNLKAGAVYLQKFLYSYPHFAIIMALFLLFLVQLLYKAGKERSWKIFDSSEKIQLILMIIFLAGLFLPVPTGGDHFKFARFYQCIVPVGIAGGLNYSMWEKHIGSFITIQRRNALLLGCIVAFGMFFMAKSTWFDFTSPRRITDDRILRDFYYAQNGRDIGRKTNETFSLADHWPSIGLIAAGGFGYTYKGNTIDLMGLNSTLMAHASKNKVGPRNHASFDINTFWKLHPDMVGIFFGTEVVTDTAGFILPENLSEFRKSRFTYIVYKKIFDTKKFIDNYIPALVRKKELDFYLFAYYDKAFLAGLDTTRFMIKELKRHVPL